MSTANLELGAAYLKALHDKDLKKIESYVLPNVKFKSPLAEATTRAEFLAATERVLAAHQGVTVRAQLGGDGNQAAFVYDLAFAAPVGAVRTASLMTFADGKIAAFELFFDTRPFGPPPK